MDVILDNIEAFKVCTYKLSLSVFYYFFFFLFSFQKKLTQNQDLVEKFVLEPQNHDVLSIVKAARNGAVYGSKVRFPHALV